MNKKFLILFVVFINVFPCYSQNITDFDANKIADAIYIIEGGAKTKYPYGIKSIKTNNPRQICLNTVRNNYKRWANNGYRGEFVDFLADRYCPPSADKQGNINWKKNIRKVLTK